MAASKVEALLVPGEDEGTLKFTPFEADQYGDVLAALLSEAEEPVQMRAVEILQIFADEQGFPKGTCHATLYRVCVFASVS